MQRCPLNVFDMCILLRPSVYTRLNLSCQEGNPLVLPDHFLNPGSTFFRGGVGCEFNEILHSALFKIQNHL